MNGKSRQSLAAGLFVLVAWYATLTSCHVEAIDTLETREAGQLIRSWQFLQAHRVDFNLAVQNRAGWDQGTDYHHLEVLRFYENSGTSHKRSSGTVAMPLHELWNAFLLGLNDEGLNGALIDLRLR